ncbi:MAG: hypothetical protein ACI9R3_005544, partial [Verrucomicrobiales bacterium]
HSLNRSRQHGAKKSLCLDRKSIVQAQQPINENVMASDIQRAYYLQEMRYATNSSRMKSPSNRNLMWLTPFVVALFLSSATGQENPTNEATELDVVRDPDGIARAVVESEELVLKLMPSLRALAKSMVSRSRDSLPDPVATDVSHHQWPELQGDGLEWTDASFGILSAELRASSLTMLTKFEGVRRGGGGVIVGVQAKQRLKWVEQEPDQWRLVDWTCRGADLDRSEAPLFEEVLEKALPDWIARDQARRSVQEETTEKALTEMKLLLAKREYVDLADMESAFQYPSVSVVDYDVDGHDDLFITARWASPQLLRNRGDGTFEDVTFRSGLIPENCVNCALFADFDNDGDPDALLGRSLEPTLYYRNDGGKFHDVTAELSDLGRQFFVVSAAAADVNRDGLLDVYLSTYSPGDDVLPVWKKRYLTPEQAQKLDAISTGAHPYFDDRGVPNVLLMNRGGGRLERVGSEVGVELWRKSYQPVWADVDGDGDDDLYVCNDFAPDSFLRNDTPQGAADPVFVDAFAEVFPDGQMAFGMGASFGDYDTDGDLDLFVSNMYSKAGNRIIAAVGNVDPRIKVAARGNFLYQNLGGTFRQVARADMPETKVGWAFGGQFADFNNDGRLDLYVPSGYYSAPKKVATGVDL